jgi:Phage capsid family
MTNPLDLGFARTAHRLVQQADTALKFMTRSEQRQLLLTDIMAGLQSHERRVTGFANECLQERARIQGTDYDPRCPTVPWSTIAAETRAPLSADLGGAAGSYLVGTTTDSEVIDILRPDSLAIQCGATVYDGLESNAIFPRLTTDLVGTWLGSDSANITEQPPLFGSHAVVAKTVGFFCRYSRQLDEQAPNMELFLRQAFRRAAGQAVDTLALTGPDGTGQLLGLLNTNGIGTQSGTSYSHANSWTTRGTLAATNTVDVNISWLGAPGVRTILAARERSTASNGFIWEADRITTRPARVSTIVPSGTLIAGDFSSLTFCFFGDGFQIDATQFNSASDFATGIYAMRLMVSVDTFLQHPAAFVAVNGIT